MYLKYGNMCSHTNIKKYRYYIVFHSTEHFFPIKCMHFFTWTFLGEKCCYSLRSSNYKMSIQLSEAVLFWLHSGDDVISHSVLLNRSFFPSYSSALSDAVTSKRKR